VADEARDEALETLERIGYVDDERYAGARAESLAARGYGDEGIRHLLAADGVAADAAEAAVAALEPERDRAGRLVERLGATARTAGQLQRKGFSEDSLETALERGFAADDAET
jgi:SOS response regulatory protein OraA/RecX